MDSLERIELYHNPNEGRDITNRNFEKVQQYAFSGNTGGTASSDVWTSGTEGKYSIRANNDSGTDAFGDYSFANGYGALAYDKAEQCFAGDYISRIGDSQIREHHFCGKLTDQNELLFSGLTIQNDTIVCSTEIRFLYFCTENIAISGESFLNSIVLPEQQISLTNMFIFVNKGNSLSAMTNFEGFFYFNNDNVHSPKYLISLSSKTEDNIVWFSTSISETEYSLGKFTGTCNFSLYTKSITTSIV